MLEHIIGWADTPFGRLDGETLQAGVFNMGGAAVVNCVGSLERARGPA